MERLIRNRDCHIFDIEADLPTEPLLKEDHLMDYECNPLIKSWVDEIKSSAEEIVVCGTDFNGFQNKNFIEDFIKLVGYEFPLWSAACLPGNQNHATTSYVDAYFNDKKNRVLGGHKILLRVDKFLKIEYQDHKGGSAIFNTMVLSSMNDRTGSQQPFVVKGIEPEDSIMNPDADSYDNWRNKCPQQKPDIARPLLQE